MDNEEKTRELIDKYLRGTCTREEKLLVERFYNDQFRQNNLPGKLPARDLKASMWKHVSKASRSGKTTAAFLSWSRVAAVMAFLLLAGASLFFFVRPQIFRSSTEAVYKNDIAPGGNKASLVLTDGRKMDLSSEKEGISLQAGKLTYMDGAGLEMRLTEYATLTTPRGGQYQLALPDGSRVWLNAASSLTYPTSFDGQEERRVRLTGEAYFEIAKDDGHPFIVESKKQSVLVLGTHFNISAYSDESSVQTTLAEGSITVSRKGSDDEQILRPGEQAIISGDDLHVRQVDPGDVLAWKNGQFQFNDESLESIMQKVARWYDVEVVFEDDTIKEYAFVGVIDRFSNVSEVLNMLQVTGKIKFRIEGRRIFVMEK